MENFAALFPDVSILENSVALCITGVDQAQNLEIMKRLIARIKNESRCLTDQSNNKLSDGAITVLEYAEKSMHLFFKPIEEGIIQYPQLFTNIDT